MQKRYNIKIHKRVDKFLVSHPEMQKPFFQALHVLAEDIHTREIDIKALS